MNHISVYSNVHYIWDICFFEERYQFFCCTMNFFFLFVFSMQVKNYFLVVFLAVCLLSSFFLSNFLSNLVFKSDR